MKYTNTLNLPESLCKAVEREDYDPGSSDVTVTEIVKPVQQAVLERVHRDEIVQDVSDQIFALFGKAVHHILEKSDTELTENRLYYSFDDGSTLGGQYDRLVLKDGLLQDYKLTSVWTRIFDSMDDWRTQLNLYAFLCNENNHPVEKLQIITIYRDWSATMAERDPNYPQQQVEIIDVPIWASMHAYERIKDWVYTFMGCLEREQEGNRMQLPLPECTPEQMWETPTKYALRKEGRKTAIKISESQQDLIDYAVGKGFAVDATVSDRLKDEYTIEVRPGQRKRCEKYCNAAPWCTQYEDYQIQKQGES